MNQDYISYIRSKVGHDKIMLNFAGGILTDEAGRVLLQLRGDMHTWGLPGGAMELGESSVDTCKREFLEETGITVEPVHLLNIYSNTETHYPNGDKTQSIVILYEVKALSDATKLDFTDSETLALRFFSREEIAGMTDLFEKHRVMLEEFFSGHFEMGR